jgi:hypothetical protein
VSAPLPDRALEDVRRILRDEGRRRLAAAERSPTPTAAAERIGVHSTKTAVRPAVDAVRRSSTATTQPATREGAA